MENYRYIEIEEDLEEEENEDEEDYEDEEENEDGFIREEIMFPNLLHDSGEEDDDDYEEDEDEDEDEEDYDEGEEYEEEFIRGEILFPNLLYNSGQEDGNDDEGEEGEGEGDYEEEQEDYEDVEEEEFIPVRRRIPMGTVEDDDFEDEDEEAYDSEEEEMEELIPIEMPTSRVSNSIVDGRRLDGTAVDNGLLDDSNVSELSYRNSVNQELNKGETDGLSCPICFEAWTSSGDHQICCLPCGHIYGLSCIKKWLQQRQIPGKCPQCNGLCTSKDIRVLYTTRLCVADEELQKRVRSLEIKCAHLEEKAASPTPEELIDQIRRNPMLVQRLAAALAELEQPQEDRLRVFKV